MRRIKISTIQYLSITGLFLTSALAVTQINELHFEQIHLQQKLVEMRQENEVLVDQINLYREQVEELEQEKIELRELLAIRARTFQIVTGSLAAASRGHEQLLSRSGRPVPVGLTGTRMTLVSLSGFSAQCFERAWRQYGTTELYGTGEVLVQAEERYGLNALALAAIVVHESGWGRSSLARKKNNLAGLNAIDSNPYGNAFTFATKADSIFFLARLLRHKYLTPGASFYRGHNLSAVNACYATDSYWAAKVAAIMGIIARAAVDDPEALMASLR
ncbi:MAG: glucosaminidase domain-containing protein [Bacillota bacterium]